VIIAAVPDRTGVVTGVTEVRFLAEVTGLAGGSVEYQWDLGDGATATAPSPSHVYLEEGVFTVRLTVQGSAGRRATATRVVTARTVTGTWHGVTYEWWFELRQDGSTISGRVLGQRDQRYSGVVPLTGLIEPPNTIRFTVPNFPALGFTGPPEPSMDRLVGQIEFQVPRSETLVRVGT